MGNETSGFAVLNLSSYTVHCGLSMGATHYYENNVKHGEIFYRWPGAVFYTVYVKKVPELSEGTETAAPAVPDPASNLVLAAEGGAASSGAQAVYSGKAVLDVLASVDATDLYAEKKGCYGGGSGTWLVLRGGLQCESGGHVRHEKLRLQEVDPKYVLSNGKFTSYSYEKFYTTEKAKKHEQAGHSCSRAKCKLLS